MPFSIFNNPHHFSKNDPERFTKELQKLDVQKRVKLLGIHDSIGYTVLHTLAFFHPKYLERCLAGLDPNQITELLGIQDSVFSKTTLMVLEVYHPEYFESFLAGLDPKQIAQLLGIKDSIGETVLHRLAIRHPEYLERYLNGLNRERKAEFLEIRSSCGETVLHKLAIRHPEYLERYLKGLNREQKTKLLEMRGSCGYTVLEMLTIWHPNFVHHTLLKEPEIEPSQLLLHQITPLAAATQSSSEVATVTDTLSSINLVDYSITNPELFMEKFEQLDVQAKAKLLATQGSNGDTVLMKLAIHHPTYLKGCLKGLDSKQRTELLGIKSSNGDTALMSLAVCYPECIGMCLTGLQSEEKFSLLSIENYHGNTVLTLLARCYPDYFKKWLAGLRPDQIHQMFQSFYKVSSVKLMLDLIEILFDEGFAKKEVFEEVSFDWFARKLNTLVDNALDGAGIKRTIKFLSDYLTQNDTEYNSRIEQIIASPSFQEPLFSAAAKNQEVRNLLFDLLINHPFRFERKYVTSAVKEGLVTYLENRADTSSKLEAWTDKNTALGQLIDTHTGRFSFGETATRKAVTALQRSLATKKSKSFSSSSYTLWGRQPPALPLSQKAQRALKASAKEMFNGL